MSNALAIAGVTAVLRDLLNDGLINQNVSGVLGSTVSVSTLPPDRVVPTNGTESSQLNLFLHQVTPNSGWRNEGLPSRDSSGRQRLSNPPLALNLHYLLSAYGATELHAEVLLGCAVQVLHETPVLGPEAINTALTPPPNPPPLLVALADAGLADQVEQIKITLEYLNTEEMSKLWTAAQSHYRPTAAYQATVVLMEASAPTRKALPVQERRLHVMPFRQPRIDAVSPQFLTAGGVLTLHGQNLRNDQMRVMVGEASVVPNPGQIAENQIAVTLPGQLRAGVNTVRVIHELNFNTPNEPHGGFASNVAAFVLRPHISAITASSSQISLQVEPVVGKGQRATLLLNGRSATAPAAYSFSAAPQPAETSSLTFPITDVQTGEYFVRLQVDGAESALDLSPSNPGPTVTLP